MLLAASASALNLPMAGRPASAVAVANRAAACSPAMSATASAETEAPPSFVQTEMRGAAMKLHTRDQSPREGQQPAQTPVKAWEPQREDYLQFLVDSRHVFAAFEAIVARTERLAPFRDSGLERAASLSEDVAWFEAEYGLPPPDVAQPGRDYAAEVERMCAEGEWERFVCHFYNFYFAHTAGGQMIGKSMSDKLLGGRTLHFYQWQGDVKADLLPRLRGRIDAMAAAWDREQKDACLAETAASFKGGGSLLSHIRGPR